MATDKMFVVAGTSTLKGETKVRFANDVMRAKVLQKHGHEDILLVVLPNPMTKLEAALFIQNIDEFNGTNEQIAISEFIEKNSKSTSKRTSKVESDTVETSSDDVDDDKPIGYAELDKSFDEALM